MATNLHHLYGCFPGTHFRWDTPPGLRIEHTNLIKNLNGTCVIAHQCEAHTDTTELLT
jgi:hypothetical protein